jgi:two-component system sensor histidine kinase RpfC
MLSADVTPEARAECTEAGAAAFITKPVRARTLLESLGNLVVHHGDGPQTAGESPPADLDPADAPPISHGNADILDRQALRDLEDLGGGLDFVANLVDGFIRDAENLFDQLEKSIAERTLRQFRDQSHALKGSAGSIGARRLHELSGRACRISERDFVRIAPMALSEMRSTLAETQTALKRYINERQGQVSRN